MATHSSVLAWRIPGTKRLWCWEGLGAGGEGDDRRWDGWMASLTWWTWVWVNSRSWWGTGSPGMLRFMGSQRVGHDWVTELNWTELNIHIYMCVYIYTYATSSLPSVDADLGCSTSWPLWTVLLLWTRGRMCLFNLVFLLRQISWGWISLVLVCLRSLYLSFLKNNFAEYSWSTFWPSIWP